MNLQDLKQLVLEAKYISANEKNSLLEELSVLKSSELSKSLFEKIVKFIEMEIKLSQDQLKKDKNQLSVCEEEIYHLNSDLAPVIQAEVQQGLQEMSKIKDEYKQNLVQIEHDFEKSLEEEIVKENEKNQADQIRNNLQY